MTKLCSRFHFRKYIFLLLGDLFGIYLLLNPLKFMMRDMEYVPNFVHPSELFHAGLYGMYLIIALENSLILKHLFSKLSWLGDVSFAIYLSHNPLLVLHSNLIQLDYFNEIGNDIGMIFFIAWVVVISYCIHHHFENPVKKHLDEQLGLTKKKRKMNINKHVE
jgi:peptidoglycan/LPS O-acetylase OafA/YrhL